MGEMANWKATHPHDSIPRWFEPQHIFNEEGFVKWFSECKPPKKEEKSA